MKRHIATGEARLEEITSLLLMLIAALSDCALEFRGLSQSILQISAAILSAVVSVSWRFTMPKPICFNQPVTFQDAVGKIFPIHLEWINCWEVSFKDVWPISDW